jgi:hypothetical protein
VLLVLLAVSTVGRAAERRHGPSEGIKVHGHWTLEIRNPDGSVASRHEVENELVVMVGGGNSLLAGLLANYYSDPIWTISLWGPNSTGPCLHESSPDMWPCRITESRAPFSGTEYSKNLVLGMPLVGPAPLMRPVGTLQLSGSTVAAHDSSIVSMDSTWYVAAKNHHGSFTMKALTPAIELRAGQIIQVKVVFSFS